MIYSTSIPSSFHNELKSFREGLIIMIETQPEMANPISIEMLKFLTKKNFSFIIISSTRPFVSLLSFYNEHGIDCRNFAFIDLVTKRSNKNDAAFNHKLVNFIDSPASLTDISLAFDSTCNKFQNKKVIVFFDSINTMLLYNDAKIFAQFIHALLIKIRLNNFGGMLLLMKEQTDNIIRAEIIHLCDKTVTL